MAREMVGDGRRARSSRAVKMGSKESKSNPKSENDDKGTSKSTRPRVIVPAPEKVPVWPKNSARWQKPYDVYICSSDQDIMYATSLLSYLQAQPENLRCFLPVRDLNPGGAIPTEIVDGVESSHCWILLLTSASISDPWCQYQMHHFLALAPNGNGCLIPVMLQLSFEHYPKELRHMFSYKDLYGDRKVFELLKKAIVRHLTSLPTITPDRNSGEETISNAYESSSSISPVGIKSQDMSSKTPESASDCSSRSVTQGSISDTSLTSAVTQGATGDTSMSSVIQGSTSDSLKRSVTQESTGDTTLISTMTQGATDDTSISSVTQGSTSNLSRRSVTQGSPGDTSLRSSIAPESTNITSVRRDINQEATLDTSIQTSLIEKLTSTTSMRSSNSQMSTSNTSEKCSLNQETVSEPSLKFPYEQESTSNSIVCSSLNEESTNSMSVRTHIRQGYTSDRPMTNPVTEVSTCGIVMGSPVMEESTSNTRLRASSPKPNMDLSLRNYETLVTNTWTTNCKIMYSSTAKVIFSKQKNAITQEDHCGSCKEEETTKMDCHSFGSDIYTSATKNKGSTSLHSITNTGCGGSQVNQDSAVLHGDIYTSHGGTSAQMKDSLDLQGDIYTSRRTKAEVLQSLQSNLYTSCETKTEAKDSGSDLYTSGGLQEGKRDTLSFQSNIYTSSSSKDNQCLKVGYTGCGMIEEKTVDSEVLLEDIYASGGMQSKNEDSPSRQGDINTTYDGEHAHMDLQSLQTDLYTSSTGNQREDSTACDFQSNLYTSHREKQEAIEKAQNLPGEIIPGFGGLQTPRKLSESLQSDIYTSSDGTSKVTKDVPELCSGLYLSGAGTQTMNQNFPSLQGDPCTICTDNQAEDEYTDNSSSNIYTSCTGAKALGSESCVSQGISYMNSSSTQSMTPTIYTHKDDISRPASEAADKT